MELGEVFALLLCVGIALYSVRHCLRSILNRIYLNFVIHDQ